MNKEIFKIYTNGTMQECANTLSTRIASYGKDDNILHNFEVAAVLQGISREEALRGMMAKHIVKLNDMVADPDKYTKELWQEVIGDIINYLLNLSAMVKED